MSLLLLGAGPATDAVPIVTEYVKNGTFATDTDWTKSAASVTISGGKAHFASAAGTRRLYQPSLGVYVAGNSYRITGTTSSYVGGIVGCRIGCDSSGLNGTVVIVDPNTGDANFTVDVVLTTLTDQYHVFSATTGGQFDLDDLSIVPL